MIAQRYRLLGLLGAGGMGAVYRAEDLQWGDTVALKLSKPTSSERALREGEALRRLDHPALVKARDCGSDRGVVYLAMELVSGRPLSTLVQGQQLPWERAVEIARALGEALAHAHEEGVLHRDVKPGNVLLGSDGAPVLVDFGLAGGSLGVESLTQTGQVMGTPGFLPPEQALGVRDQVGIGSDVYGLGATLYAMLTGQPPFTLQALLDFARTPRATAPPPSRLRPGLPRELDAVCARCLARTPAERYASARDLVQALEALVDAPARGRPLWPVVLVAGLAVVSAGLAVAVWNREGQSPEPAAPAPAVNDAPELFELAQRDLATAQEEARARLAADPDDVDALEVLANAELASERWEAGLEFAQRALKIEPGRGSLEFVVGQALLNGRQDFAGAEAALSRALERGFEPPGVWNLRGLCRMNLGRREEAYADLQQAVFLAPDLTPAHVNLSTLMTQANRWEEARDHATRALELPGDEADHSTARRNRIEIDQMLGRLADSAADVELLLERYPQDVDLRSNRLHLQLLRGRYAEALAEAEAIQQLSDPQTRATMVELVGMIRQRLGLRDAEGWVRTAQAAPGPRLAHGDFSRALELDPNLHAALEGRAQMREALGYLPAALADLELLERAGGGSPAMFAAARGSMLTYLERFEEATAHVERFLEFFPDDVNALTNLALCYGQQRRYAEALQAVDKALASAPDDVRALSNRGAILLEWGRYEEAVTTFDRVLQLEPGNLRIAEVRERARRQRDAQR